MIKNKEFQALMGAGFKIKKENDGCFTITTPFFYGNGDSVNLYLVQKERRAVDEDIIWELTDVGDFNFNLNCGNVSIETLEINSALKSEYHYYYYENEIYMPIKSLKELPDRIFDFCALMFELQGFWRGVRDDR